MGTSAGGGKGRGASGNPVNRFAPLSVEPDPEAAAEERSGLQTRFYVDASETIITFNSSPDLPFSASINPYRGCEHGCAYCYARPTHEYLGLSAGLDFETKIMVKERAPALLRRELSAAKWKPQVIAMSGVTDPYQPAERRLGLTRACLSTLLEFRNPVGIVTKNRLVARDADILGEMAALNLCHVHLSINSLDADLARKMEPRTSSPQGRLEAISALAQKGVPVGVLVAPVIPGLNDHELPALLEAVAAAGARSANFILLRLPHGVGDLFFDWLRQHFPLKARRVEERLRAARGGALNRSAFGERFRGQGIFAEQIRLLYEAGMRRAGLDRELPPLSVDKFRRPPAAPSPQLELGL